MNTVFLRGCERVVWFPGKSESFRQIVEQKVPKQLTAIGSLGHKEAAAGFGRWLASNLKRGKVYQVEAADLVFFGQTVNNRKEFSFLSEVLNDNSISATCKSFLDDFPVTSADNHLVRKIADWVVGETTNFCSERSLSPAQLWQLYQYCATYIRIHASYEGQRDHLPGLGVVANDHSPSQVAFKAVMEGHEVPVIYVQHAQVSSDFPPLDFYLSILRNQASLTAYREAGAVHGETVILSRYPKSKIREVPNVAPEHQARITVGVYPTSRFDPDILLGVAESLSRNPVVQSVFVKLHPNTATKLDKHQAARLQLKHTLPEEPHVAVVGNSSVVLDLLAAGIPVYQLFELDTVKPDYYGFVATGITPEIKSDELVNPEFWRSSFYDDEWLSRMANFEPSARGDGDVVGRRVAELVSAKLPGRSAGSGEAIAPKSNVGTAKNRKFRSAINRTLARGLRRGVALARTKFPRQMDRLLSIIASIDSPLELSGKSTSIGALMDRSSDPLRLADAILSTSTSGHELREMNRWFQARWAMRDPRAFDLVRSAGSSLSSPIHIWLRVLAFEIMALPLSEGDAATLVREIEAIQITAVRKICEDAAMRVLIRNGHGREFLHLLKHSPIRQMVPLSSNMKVEVAKLIFSSEENISGEDADAFLSELSGFERTKIVASGVPIWEMKSDHAELEKRFASFMRPSLSKTFSEVVLPVYEQLRPQMRFIDARTNPAQRAALTAEIHEALANKRAFSLIRLGDGEAYLFDLDLNLFTDADRDMRERHWWNMQMNEDDRTALRKRSLAAVAAADVVGIPTIHRFFRDFSDRSPELLAGVANRGVVTSLLGAAAVLPKTTMLTEDRIHHLIFDEQPLRDLMHAAERVVIVSSLRPEVIVDTFGSSSVNVKAVAIPTHAKTKGNPKFLDWNEPLPLVAENVEHHLRDLVRSGDLVLVSAGVAGKSFVGVAKEKGAVGLDVGGQIEPLVGIPNGPIF